MKYKRMLIVAYLFIQSFRNLYSAF